MDEEKSLPQRKMLSEPIKLTLYTRFVGCVKLIRGAITHTHTHIQTNKVNAIRTHHFKSIKV